jgi:hypothetical protein
MRCDIRVFIVHRYARAAQRGVTPCVCRHAKVRTDEIWLHKKMVIGTSARVKVKAPAEHRDNGRRLGQLVTCTLLKLSQSEAACARIFLTA